MNKEIGERLIKISELLEKALECLDNVLSQFLDNIKELPINEQEDFYRILHNFCYHMKASVEEFELTLKPLPDYSSQYII